MRFSSMAWTSDRCVGASAMASARWPSGRAASPCPQPIPPQSWAPRPSASPCHSTSRERRHHRGSRCRVRCCGHRSQPSHLVKTLPVNLVTPVLLPNDSASRPARREPDISFCRARHSDLADHVDCLADHPGRCPHSLCFGSCSFCLHPRRNEIAAHTEAARYDWSADDDRGLATVSNDNPGTPRGRAAQEGNRHVRQTA